MVADGVSIVSRRNKRSRRFPERFQETSGARNTSLRRPLEAAA